VPTKNKLSDLRDHLFETLEALKDEEKPMELARAKAIADVAQTIINSATVEVKAAAAFGQANSEFFDGQARNALPPAKAQPNGNGNGQRVLTNSNSVRPTTQ
jgi:hypothetical protein